MNNRKIFWILGLIAAGCSSNSNVNPFPSLTPTIPSASLPTQTLAAGQAGVEGILTISPQCGSGQSEVFLMNNSGQVVYESAPLNSGGSYEMTALPGNYVIGAYSNAQNCGAQQTITLSSGQSTTVNLLLSPTGGGGGYSQPYGYSYGYPTGYPNCPYGPYGYGCDGGSYPGEGGGGFVGKPNVYLSGTTGMPVEVKLNYPQSTVLLIASPAHGNASWKGKLTSKGGINVSGVDYSYLFYDMRYDVNKLQSSDAICLDKSGLMPALVDYLKNAGFKSNENSDFETYWTKKMIPAPKYCVYPQEQRDIAAISDLQISPKPDSVVRVWFLVIPEPAQTKTASNALFKKFHQPKHGLTELAFAQRHTPVANRAIASTPFEVHEWGVGFLAEPSSK